MAVLFQILFLQFMLFSFSHAHVDGFTTDFFHRDSPKSPHFDPSLSQYDRLRNALRRSITRANRIKLSSSVGSKDTIPSRMTAGGGEYLMKVSIGTPPVELVGIADTGSDLIWTQCQPCQLCYKQIPPIFDPRKSSSYQILGCKTDYCTAQDETTCSNDEQKSCQYSDSYDDGSYTSGTLSVEKLTIEPSTGGQVEFENIVFGCGHRNGGIFDEQGSGIMGLGAGQISLVSQLSKSISRKFSYCLAPEYTNSNVTSQINLGSNANVIGPGVVSTPLLIDYPDTFYYLTLEALTVGRSRLEHDHDSSSFRLKAKVDAQDGNIIIDSGTTLTFLPTDLYNKLEKALANVITAKPVHDPTGTSNLCYEAKHDIELPIITAHFGGADVKWWPINTFSKVSEDVVCLMIVPTADLAILGNMAQVNFQIGYDLEEKTLSFKPTECGCERDEEESKAVEFRFTPKKRFELAQAIFERALMEAESESRQSR